MDKELSRRRVLKTTSIAALATLAGCQGKEQSDSSSGEESKTSDQTTQWSRIHPLELLPREDERWKQQYYERQDYSLIGGEEGVKSLYKSSKGIEAKVVIFRPLDKYSEQMKAKQFACAGWQVSIPFKGFVFAGTSVSDRTESQTSTTVPSGQTVSKVPSGEPTVSGSRQNIVSLLSNCPGLAREKIINQETTCENQ